MQIVISSLVLWLFTCVLVANVACLDVYTSHSSSNITQLEAIYTTIGSLLETPITANITLVTKDNLHCGFKNNIPLSAIKDHILVYTSDMWEELLFKPCTNYFMDEAANAVEFAKLAQEKGAVGVIVGRYDSEKKYSGYRIVGFNDDISIPVLVAPKSTFQFLVANKSEILNVHIPPVSPEDKDLIQHLQRIYKGFSIVNCIVWPLLMVLTAYFIFVDLRSYFALAKKARTIHPTLTKAAPFASALFASIWHLADPYPYKLMTHFPANFFERFHFGLLFVTALLLLKTWILAVGDKLKSEKIYRYSLMLINIFTSLTVLMTILWVAVGARFLTVAIVFGALTSVICGVGFIYYGKDIVIILSKQGKNATHRHLSLKIIIFTVVFVLFVYATAVIYISNLFGATLSEFCMQFLLGASFVIIYSVLFFRRNTHPTPSPSASNMGKTSHSNNSKNSHSSISLSSQNHSHQSESYSQDRSQQDHSHNSENVV